MLCQHHLSFFRLLKKSVGTDGNAEKDDKTDTLNVTNKKRLLPCTVAIRPRGYKRQGAS